MVFSKIFVILCLVLFSISPLLVLADTNTQDANPSKTDIMVKPNTVIVQPYDNSTISKMIEPISAISTTIIKGDTLLSSSTIVGFFGFGSFVAMRLQGASIGEQGRLMQLVYISSFMVIFFHLIIIFSVVVLGLMDLTFYSIVIYITMGAVAIIAWAICEIITLQVRDAKLEAQTIEQTHMEARRQRRLLAVSRSPVNRENTD